VRGSCGRLGGRVVMRDLSGLARADDKRDDKGEREHDRAGGERGRDAVGEEVPGAERARVGGGEHRDEDAESEGTAEPVGDVDEPGSSTGVPAADASNPGEVKRAESGALADAGQGSPTWAATGSGGSPRRAPSLSSPPASPQTGRRCIKKRCGPLNAKEGLRKEGDPAALVT
jgi:hypothetical protein